MTATRTLRGKFHGVPSYFKALVRSARAGGDRSYAEAGYHLALHLPVPDDAEAGEWETEIDDLHERCVGEWPEGVPTNVVIHRADPRFADPRTEQEIDRDVLDWFLLHYPRCMELVPRKRRSVFVEGVLQVVENDRLGSS